MIGIILIKINMKVIGKLFLNKLVGDFMFNLISNNLNNILSGIQKFSNNINTATEQIVIDFLPESANYANYFSEYFTNSLIFLIKENKVSNVSTLLSNEDIKNFIINHSESGINIGKILLQKSYAKEALAVFDLVLEKNPDLLDVNIQKGLCLLEIRDYDKADVFYQNILKKYPNNFILNETYARNAHRRGDWEEALRRWTKVLMMFPDSKNPVNQLTFIYNKFDYMEEQLKSAFKLLSNSSNRVLSIYANAKLLEMDLDFLKASRCYQEILLRDMHHQEAIKGLLICYAKIKDWDALKNHIMRVNQSKISVDFKIDLSNVLSNLFLYDLSDFLLKNLLSLDMHNEKVLYKIALNNIYYNYGNTQFDRYKQGVEILKGLVERFPGDNRYRVDLIHMCIGLNMVNEAQEYMKNLDKNYPHNYVPRFFAWQKYINGDIEGAKNDWQEIAKKQYIIAFKDVEHELEYLGKKPILVNKNDIVLFSPVYNEMLRLPAFLSHYRKLGVNKFFIIDNNSTDGTLDYLLLQDDVFLFHTKNSYSEAGHGIAWVNYLIHSFIDINNNNWILHVDVDELLIYPEYETKNLQYLCSYLDDKGCSVLPSFMLDMFPRTLKEQLLIKSGDNLIEKTGYFYNDYAMLNTVNPPYLAPRGGIFSKLLGPKYLPLIKAHKTWHLSSTHICTPEKISEITSVLLHFKLIGDFKTKAQEEVQRKQHAGGGGNYKGYYFMMNSFSDDFDYTSLEKTVKYENSQQLVDLGIMHKPLDF